VCTENSTSRPLLEALVRDGHLAALIKAGARIHQAGCNGCIGMGQAPAIGRNSLRTVPRSVFLCSPETATAAALTGRITDPRDLKMACPRISPSDSPVINTEMLIPPLPERQARQVELIKGPNIAPLPNLDPLPDSMALPVLLKVGDDVSTDEILPAGARVLPFRSNIPKISEFCFEIIDESYPRRAEEMRDTGGHVVVGEHNYGQGSSREHAVLAPRSWTARGLGKNVCSDPLAEPRQLRRPATDFRPYGRL
jgi:aconitate hydratase